MPNASNFSKKWSQQNHHTKPWWNCPWPRGAVLQYPWFLHIFMQFLLIIAIFAFFICFVMVFAHFGLKKTSIFYHKHSTLVGLPWWNCPWPRGGVLQCPSMQPFFIYLLQLYEFLVITLIFCHIFRQFFDINQKQFYEFLLYQNWRGNHFSRNSVPPDKGRNEIAVLN